MGKESNAPKTLGQAIDEIIEALGGFDQPTQITAIRAACDHLKIRAPARTEASSNSSAVAAVGTSASAEQGQLTDARALKELKKPTSANEMAALVAFYLSETASNERKTDVEVADMERYFKQASFPLPRKPAMLLSNAKNAGYFDMLGNGKYRLNAVGYNLVAHNLPRGQSDGRPRRRKPKRKKANGRRKVDRN
jgi:hypothetical protein